MSRNKNISPSLEDFNMPCTAFLGVISLNKGLYYYKLYEKSVNTIKFNEFIKELSAKHGKKPCAIFMDNLRVHKNLAIRPYLDER